LRGRLQLSIDAAIALLQARGIPGQVDVDQIMTAHLQVDALASSVQMRMRRGSDAGSELKRRFSSSRRSVEVAPVKEAIRRSSSISSSASARRVSS
jgi:hypothetical protein